MRKVMNRITQHIPGTTARPLIWGGGEKHHNPNKNPQKYCGGKRVQNTWGKIKNESLPRTLGIDKFSGSEIYARRHFLYGHFPSFVCFHLYNIIVYKYCFIFILNYII